MTSAARTWTIEKGVAIPEVLRHPGMTRHLRSMEVGDSIPLATEKEYISARGLCTRLRPLRFVVRKLCDGQGWRIWRTE